MDVLSGRHFVRTAFDVLSRRRFVSYTCKSCYMLLSKLLLEFDLHFVCGSSQPVRWAFGNVFCPACYCASRKKIWNTLLIMIFYHLLYCKEQSHNHSSFVNFCVLGVRSFEGTHFNKFLTHFRFLTITSSPVHSDGYITANYCNDNDDEEPPSLSVLTISLFKIAANRT